MTSTYTSVPEVKGYLYDTLLPAAVASLAATVTVSGSTYQLRPPEIHYGTIASPAVPPSYIIVGPTEGGDTTSQRVLPASSNRSRREDYGVQLLIWYRIGDTSDTAQRIATESGYAIFRAIAARVYADQRFGVLLPPGSTAELSQVTDSEYDAAEGRGVGLTCTLHVAGPI